MQPSGGHSPGSMSWFNKKSQRRKHEETSSGPISDHRLLSAGLLARLGSPTPNCWRWFCCILIAGPTCDLIPSSPPSRRLMMAVIQLGGAGLSLLSLHCRGVQGSRACVSEAAVSLSELHRAYRHLLKNLFPPPASSSVRRHHGRRHHGRRHRSLSVF